MFPKGAFTGRFGGGGGQDLDDLDGKTSTDGLQCEGRHAYPFLNPPSSAHSRTIFPLPSLVPRPNRRRSTWCLHNGRF